MFANPLQLVGYARVSTEDQKDRGSSLAAQKERIIAVATARGDRLRALLEDGGESAKSIDRPALAVALGMLGRGEVEGLIVANLDRLTRNLGDLVGMVDRHFTAAGGPVLLSCSEPVETRTAVGRLQLFILATVSQYQREAGAERTAGVMKSKRSRSERTGNIPFGMMLDPSDARRSRAERPVALVASPGDAAVESIILELHRSGRSLGGIADYLNAYQVPSKRGVTRRSSGRWSKSTIHSIIKRSKQNGSLDHASTPTEGDGT